jgi:hypothetical protein
VRNVNVRRGETTTLPLAMTRPATITGVVKLADGTPVPGVAVTARGPVEGVGTTDAQGAFAIGDLAPGRYRLDVSSDGFESYVSKESYSLAEGATRENVSIVVTAKPPEFAFVLDREAFLPDATIRIGLRSFRIDDFDLGVYRIPDARLLDATQDVRRPAAPPTHRAVRVTSWHHVVGAGPDWTWREGELLVPEQLPPARMCCAARGGGITRAIHAVRHRSRADRQRSPTRVVTSVASLKTGEPLGDVTSTPSPRWSRGRRGAGLVERARRARGRAACTKRQHAASPRCRRRAACPRHSRASSRVPHACASSR